MLKPAGIAPASGPTIADAGERLCACGCRQPAPIHRGVPRLYVHGHNRRKHPRPDERVCARPGCETRFRPTAQTVQRGGGLYCSQTCHFEDHRADERECPTCQRTFRPLASAVARGKGRYCSNECRKTGEAVACVECGAETYRNRADVDRGYRFCSWSCWMRYRWRHDSEELRAKLGDAMRRRWKTGLGLTTVVERFRGETRRDWKRRWRAPEVGKLGGPKPKYTPEQARAVHVIKAKYPTWGPVTIARVVSNGGKRITPKQVRGILAKPA